MSRISRQLLALVVMAIAVPLAADLSGITTAPMNLPAKAYASVVGPDQNLWVLTDKGNLGRVTPAGNYTEYPLLFGSSVFSVVPGIDGNLWIPGGNGHVERVTTSGVVTDFAVAPNFYFPYPAVLGADGAIWFYGNQNPAPGGSNTWSLGRIDIYGRFTTYDLGISDLSGSGDFLRSLVSGGDGNLWLIDETKNQVLKFSLVTKKIAGTFPIPSSGGANQMTLGWDGNVWFTHANSIDRVTPDGTITEFRVPSGDQPNAILMSGDNTIWFTEPTSGKLGQLVLSSTTAGGSATINESSAGPFTDITQLIPLPPSFGGVTATASAVGHEKGKCTEVKMGFNTKTQAWEAIFNNYDPPCNVGDIDQSGGQKTLGDLFLEAFLGVTPVSETGLSPVRTLAQPTMTAVLNIDAAPGVSIANVTTNDPAATVSFGGRTATVTTSLQAATANVSLSWPGATPAGRVAGAWVLTTSAWDPDPRHHVAPFVLDTSSPSGRTGLPSIPPNVVIAPVKRGK